MKTLQLLPTLLLLHTTSFSQIGKNGNAVISATQVVNEYTWLQSDCNAGDLVIDVNNSGLNTLGTFGGPLEAGDLVMIIQMQGATIQGGVNNITWGEILSYNNCGLYEFKEVAAVPNSTNIEFTCPVENAYSSSGHVQVIRVPRYNTLTVDGGTITALPWNGLRGGIVAIEVDGLTTLTNGGKIDVTGQGFRGGLMDNQSSFGFMNFSSNSQNDGGEKGESIAGFGPEYAPLGGRFGRGAPANGGGGGSAHNSGGGGGANAGNLVPWNGLGNPDNSNPAWTTAWNLEGAGFSANQSSGGGRGGYTYSGSNQNALVAGPGNPAWGGDTRRNTGGIGGRTLDYSSGRLFVGGGGGAGDGNNGAGTNGASGGGMVYLLTYSDVVGTGQIIASGQSAPTTPPAGNDAPGGGGGGGTIVISTMGTVAGTITLTARGGDGGDQAIATNEAEGPGGGGGGGYIAYTAGAPVTNVTGGANGTTNSLGVTEFAPNGATAGGSGMVTAPISAPFMMTLAVLDDSVCIGQGTTLTAAAQDPAYNPNIQWFDAPYGGNLLASGPDFTTPNLFATTTYYLKVCPSFYVDSVTVTVIANPVFSVTTDSTTCFAGNDGSAQANGMSPFYTYLWSNGQTGPLGTGFVPGGHSVTASTGPGCLTTVNFIIEDPAPMNVVFGGSPALCFNQASGTLIATASGGTAPYTYQWVSPGVSGNTLSNILAGNYTVNITDDNGCFITANGSVTSPLPLVANITALNDANCNGSTDGEVWVGIAGGTAPYGIDWLSLANDSIYMNNLGAGNYIAEVTDANACLASVVATISEPAPFIVDVTALAQETCSNNNGSAFAAVNGGIGVLNFVWTPNVSSSNIANGLSAGLVSVVVTDEHGCTTTDDETLVDYATGTGSIASINPVTCAGGSNGNITVDMTGGSAPFNYLWSCACPNNNTATNLTAGNYSVDIVDYYGCIETVFFTIDQLPALVLDTVAITEPLCYADANGSAEVVASGGTAPFFFEWNTMPAQYNALATNLPTGTFTATVKDANNCEADLTLTITQPDDMTLQPQVLSNIICYHDSTGIATVNVGGGVAPYAYSWSNGSVNDTVSNLPAGTYIIHVYDSHNCNINSAVIIEEYTNVTAEIIGDSLFCPGDLVNFFVATNGMNNLYDYHWFVNGNLQSTQNSYSIPVYGPTEISIELVHAMNCPIIQDTIMVSPIMLHPGILDAFGTTDTLCLGESGMVQATISDWSNVTNVYWSELLAMGVGPHIVEPSADNYYVITVENSCNQIIQDSVKLNMFMPPVANIYAWGTQGCGEVNTEFGFDYVANDYALTDANWNFWLDQFNGPSPVVNFTNTMDLPAHLHLTFSNGCTFDYVDTIHLDVWDVPEANFYYNPDPAMQYEVTEFIDISHGNPVSWEWYTENQFISSDERTTHTFNEQGNFVVTEIVINEFGCSDTAQLLIEVIGDFLVYVPNTFTPDGDGHNNTFKPIMTNVKPDNYEFLIFNRWGEVVFKANNLDAEWDGTYGNEGLVQDGVYVYQIHVTDNRDKEHEYNGHITLLK
jgi:large repetitive protein